MYPTVGLQTPGEVVDANFGQMPFVYDIEEVLKVKSWIRFLLTEPEMYFFGHGPSWQLNKIKLPVCVAASSEALTSDQEILGLLLHTFKSQY